MHTSYYAFTQTHAFRWVPYARVCGYERVFMQLRLIHQWEDCLFDLYQVVLTDSVALKVLLCWLPLGPLMLKLREICTKSLRLRFILSAQVVKLTLN